MKLSRSYFLSRVYKIPEIKFEGQKLSSYSGLVIFKQFFDKINLKGRLQSCFHHLSKKSVMGCERILMILILNFILGFRKINDIIRYNDDPLALRVLGLRNMPSPTTVSRTLARCDSKGYQKFQQESRQFVLNRLSLMQMKRVTCDFDGSVLSTKRAAEGTAVGFNKKKKGMRSYYPLFATIAQTGQVLDLFHRPGNVHDSNGSDNFIQTCFATLKDQIPGCKLESRLDSSFFSDKIVTVLDSLGVEFTISVPFERFVELKLMIESRKRWRKLDDTWSFFTTNWSPQCWDKKYRFIFMKQKVKKQNKEPIQLDLFKPFEYGYDFKVIITNKTTSVKNVLQFHNGRGYQENIFSELKSQCQLDYIPFRKKVANQLYHQSAVFTHNLFRELHMEVHTKDQNTTAKRSPLWIFREANSIRQKLIHLAGRLTRPGGKLTLTLNGNAKIEADFRQYLDALVPVI